jgi:hypothetical protein
MRRLPLPREKQKGPPQGQLTENWNGDCWGAESVQSLRNFEEKMRQADADLSEMQE